MADVVAGWLATWTPRADAAVAGLAPLFASAPTPMDPRGWLPPTAVSATGCAASGL